MSTDTDTKYETPFAPTDGPYDFHWKGDAQGGKLHPGLGQFSPTLAAARQASPDVVAAIEESQAQVVAAQDALQAEREAFEAEKAAFLAVQAPAPEKRGPGRPRKNPTE